MVIVALALASLSACTDKQVSFSGDGTGGETGTGVDGGAGDGGSLSDGGTATDGGSPGDGGSTGDGGTGTVEPIERGNTIYGHVPGNGESWIIEVDPDGEKVWEYDVATAFAAEGEAGDFVPAVMDVEVLDAERILFTVPEAGIYEINRDGDVLWSHLDTLASHDVDRLPDGNTLYARTWAQKGDAQLIEVDRDGNEVWSWTGVEQYGEDERFADVIDEGKAWIHPSTVQRLADGSTTMSARNFNALLTIGADGEIVDEYTFNAPDSTELAHTEGRFRGERPHAGEWTEAGTILVGLRAPHHAFELDASDRDTVLWYKQSNRLEGIRDIDRLADGTTIIACSNRIAEFDPSDEVIWAVLADESLFPKGSEDKGYHAFHAVTRMTVDGVPINRD